MEYFYLVMTLVTLYLVAPFIILAFTIVPKVSELVSRGRIPTTEMIDQARENVKQKKGMKVNPDPKLPRVLWLWVCWPFYWSSLSNLSASLLAELEEVSSPFNRY